MCAIRREESGRVAGVRHGEKSQLTNEECAKAVDLGKFYRVPGDKRMLNRDKFSGRTASSAMC